ncbi:MAG: MBL fold metallo-hydrolase [Synergistetes bacterium]|nr:MBL fold metallo-hydrolase [Synergistota bacterium]MDW8192365.1 MBL fold metallo-hydrolase [Synergistota bacterium]
MGHATLWMEIDGVTLLTDPVSKVIWGDAYFKNHFPEIKERFPLDLVIISHTHKDHFDTKALKDIEARVFIVPFKCFRIFPRKKNALLVEMKPWEEIMLNGIRIFSLPAIHLSWLHPYPIFTYSLAYIVDSGSLSLYFAGDTGFSKSLFKKIGQKFRLDVAFLPVGTDALFFKWYHLGAIDALRAFKLLGAKAFVPIHWGVIKGISGDSLKTVIKLLKSSSSFLRLLDVGDAVSWRELLMGGGTAPPLLTFPKQV